MKKFLSRTALLSAVAGFAGGFVAQEVVSPVPAYSQLIVPAPSRPEQRPAATEVDAQRFVLVDSTGRVNAEIKMKDGAPEFVLYDKDGRVGWRAVPNAFGIHPVEGNR
jgi:hypothetical protein